MHHSTVRDEAGQAGAAVGSTNTQRTTAARCKESARGYRLHMQLQTGYQEVPHKMLPAATAPCAA